MDIKEDKEQGQKPRLTPGLHAAVWTRSLHGSRKSTAAWSAEHLLETLLAHSTVPAGLDPGLEPLCSQLPQLYNNSPLLLLELRHLKGENTKHKALPLTSAGCLSCTLPTCSLRALENSDCRH